MPCKKGTSQAWIKYRHNGGETWELVFPFFHFLPDLYVFARLSSPCTVAQKGQTQISLPKHKTVSQNSNQFPKTQISLPKHKPIFQNTNQFTETQYQFHKTHTNFAKHKSKDWALALSLSESLDGTFSQDFPRPTWRLLICCPNVRKCSATTVGLRSYKSISIALNVEQS